MAHISSCTQAGVAAAAGAAAALIFDSEIDDYYLIQADAPSASSLQLPVLSIPRHTGQLLVAPEQVAVTSHSSQQ